MVTDWEQFLSSETSILAEAVVAVEQQIRRSHLVRSLRASAFTQRQLHAGTSVDS